MKLRRFHFLFFVFLAMHQTPLSSLNLEEQAQDFVLETKKIEIPGYPFAFNASIIRWQNRILLAFRHIPNPAFSFVSRLGLIWLNEDFSPASSPQLLDTQREDPFRSSLIPPRSDDGRLVQIGESLYLVYSDNKDFKISKKGFRVYIAEVKCQDGTFFLQNIEGIFRFEGESEFRREKNWTPFDYDGEMLLAYSLFPHRILRPLWGEGECESFTSTTSCIDWDWGELRGGTPGIRDGDQYLAFFHSSKPMATEHSQGKIIDHYFMGAYTFSTKPPFEITQISPEPIIGSDFYSGTEYKPFWKSVRVVFPCGFLLENEYVWVSYGKQDHEIWVVKLDKAALLDSLIPTPRHLD